ncbi:MAG TPA: hypothetical protein DEP43_01460 [Ruminococcaceae bacterium]|nr:hypothetical protein [Oscillospiraceae bacterium]
MPGEFGRIAFRSNSEAPLFTAESGASLYKEQLLPHDSCSAIHKSFPYFCPYQLKMRKSMVILDGINSSEIMTE